MFVSHEKNVNKKKFQKPNILRRKSKIPSVKLTITTGSCESPEAKTLHAPITINESTVCDVEKQTISKCRSSKLVQNVETESPETNVDDFTSYEIQLNAAEENKIEVNKKNTFESFETSNFIANSEETEDQNSLNIESFLVSCTAEEVEEVEENTSLLENDMFQPKIVDLQESQKWCLDFINNTPKLILDECDSEHVYVDQKSNVITTMVPMAAVSSAQHEESYMLPTDEIVDELTIHKLSVDQYFPRSHKFKCDVPDCNKQFKSEQKLNKHKNVHNKDGSTRLPRLTIAECPVKKIYDDGTEESCGKVFQIRDELIKHLNEEHKPEDAGYRCEECGRRFFWASGLRAHGRAHRARRTRAALACPWPGCGRVFRQPCRLREHSRAHTGDKPYPCRYPNCGWSFRTASKLMRHARRHTGERRHACAACGRAFLRREHLRDHVRRHGSGRPPRPCRPTRRACTHQGCDQTFTSTSSFYMHMKKFHTEEEEEEEDYVVETPATVDDPEPTLNDDSESLFMVTYMSEPSETDVMNKVDVEPDNVELSLNVCAAEVEGVHCAAGVDDDVGGEDDFCMDEGVGALEEEERAARTHCTWPLPPRAHAFEQPDAYVLEEEAQVEQSEISENNCYTVRSDLFLHGNVLNNDDSEHMGGAGDALDTELLLAPSVDLAQEELYTDSVDESSFRVFLLSGEDLT